MPEFTMPEASKKRMEELFQKWWFIVGGSIHGIWKRRQWSALKEFAKNVPRLGYQAGYQSGMQDPDANKELLDECEKVLLIAWGQLEAGCKEAERVDQMIEKIREARK